MSLKNNKQNGSNKKSIRHLSKKFTVVLASALIGTNLVSLLVGTSSALALGNQMNTQSSSITDPLLKLDKVSNGGFENDFKSNNQNWEYKEGGLAKLINENSNYYGLIEAGNTDDYILQVVNTTPGKKYTVSADIKVTVPEGKTPSSVFFTAKRQTEAGRQGPVYKELQFTTKTNGWERKEFEFTADTYKTYVGIVKWAQADTNGNVSATEISMDNVKVIEEDNSTVLWEESFSGNVLDQDIWGYELGNIRGNEQQHYSSSKENVFMRDGNLVLKVTDRPEEDQYRNTKKHNNNARLVKYNSGSVRTQGKQEFLYGRIEAKMKLPKGKGIFPAFWTLGADFHMDGRINTNQGYDWPSVGEIDIMEIIGAPTDAELSKGEIGKEGNSNKIAYGTPHFYYVNGDVDKDGSYSPTQLGGNITINEDFFDDYHVFGINWTPEKIEWYVDGVVYNIMYFSDPTDPVNDARLKAAAKSLNRPQYIQFNLATGGNWAGDAGDYLAGQEFAIDWVRYVQNDEQKAASEAYYADQPVLSGVNNITMIEGQQPDLLENVEVNLDNHIIDFTVENEQMFVNGGAAGGRNEVTIQVKNAADSASLKLLKPGVYNIHYTAMPKNANLNGWVSPSAKLARETATLTVLPNGGLVGNAGDLLSTVNLPEGWSWLSPNDIVGSRDKYSVVFTNSNDDTVSEENRRTYYIDIPNDFINETPIYVDQVETVIAEADNIELDGTRDKAIDASTDLQDKIQEVMSMGKGTITFRYSLNEDERIVRTNSLMHFMTIGNKDAQLEYASFYLRTKDNKIGVEVRNKNGQRDYLRQVGSGFNLISNADWHTVSYVFDGNFMQVYLDGDLYGETDFSGLLSDASWKNSVNNITLGGWIRGDQWQSGGFEGAMDKVIIDNNVLSKSEILKLHEATSRANEGEKLSMWDKFDEDIFEYRIPSIVKTPQGTLVATSDARKMHYNDWGDISTVVRVSNDDGKTWSENITVLDMPTQPYFTDKYLYTDWNTNAAQSAFSIDPILISDSNGKLYLLVDVFPESRGSVNSLPGSGHELIDGKYYLNLYDFNNNKYTVRENGIVYDKDGNETNMYVSEGEFATAFSTKGDLYRKVDGGEDELLGNIYLRSGRGKNGITIEGSRTAPLFTYMTNFLWLFTSEDQGQTWSKPVDVTASVKEDWMGFIGTGAAPGIEVDAKNDNGEDIKRLVFPIYYTNQQNITAGGLGRASSANIYSDDGGLTWHRWESPNDGRIYGDGKQTNSRSFNTAVTELSESQIVQLNNGHLLQFMRNTGKNIMIAKSTDYGETWEDVLIDSKLPEPYVNLSVIHMEIDGKEYIVLSNPTGNPDAEDSDFRTRNMRMKGALRVGEVQPDDSIKWVASKIYEPKRFAYSSLVQLDSEKVGVLFEYNGDIKYSTFNIKEMIEEGKRFDISYIENITKEVKKAESNIEENIQPNDQIIFKLKTNQNIFMIGNGQLDISIGGVNKKADYISGSGTDILTFAYTVQNGDSGEIIASEEIQNATVESVYNVPLISIEKQ